jgi:HSP20 family protein
VLPDRVDADRIRAEMKDGVLEVVLPKLERHQPRRVEVRAS